MAGRLRGMARQQGRTAMRTRGGEGRQEHRIHWDRHGRAYVVRRAGRVVVRIPLPASTGDEWLDAERETAVARRAWDVCGALNAPGVVRERMLAELGGR